MHLEEKFWEEQMNSVMKTLAEKGKKIREEMLQAIIEYIEQHGYPPTTREIGEMVGLKALLLSMHICRDFLEKVR